MEIEIMSNLQYARIQKAYGCYPIYGLHDNGTAYISYLNTSDKRLMQTLNHEAIHDTLTQIIGSEVSHMFDNLYYSQKPIVNGEYENTVQGETLRAMFTLTEEETLI